MAQIKVSLIEKIYDIKKEDANMCLRAFVKEVSILNTVILS